MARTLTAFMHRDRIPDRAALQQAIDALDRPLTLDAGDAPLASGGFRPCTLQGEDAGFDLRIGEAADTGGGHAVLLTFRWSGDPREEAAASIVCAALAAFDARIQAGDTTRSAEALLATADACLASF
ncbi:hypothetical protein [Candidatus Macondimonas diazotrophica]|jgi:hypothetical protein|uniref:Uncharacterized protein n=1 Tax=Candidatus Macondimonas diazotrophica TaxID=2305248 RepID=A0A4Z0F863_9GAMM|nr:hypothetical protein [Candidatus Macondimonas diazotrophica]NCU02123.1 hypothetical protein [Candidatus Macondimonas diazotrophica]TFZ81923.1 hypothetical protein E4680_10685 [Candidatus Macondimonas diazotrophica]